MKSAIISSLFSGSWLGSDKIGNLHNLRIKLMLGAENVDDGDVSSANPMPVSLSPLGPASPVDISGTITAGNTAQQLAAANASRQGYLIRNNSAISSLWLSDLTTAVQSQPSLEIKAGELFVCPPGGCSASALSIIGPTTGLPFTAREW